ncbi:Uncharacterised protein [uncultured Roseburia sp.]|uniref:Uncharacterized protein n=1 Tax=Brotonthovivens ammoniilytica TaxID=2981725 RepID=A0ABT2TNU5_9FIRM|nr:hypothetical protein [Brotonthovivens ammoniilytica]MCU6763139.1 hypothetical protein [Brotonthovivens ammoniilytica]SCJ04499.1 Uncharacterised protein [uncultured Roseburia sp.]
MSKTKKIVYILIALILILSFVLQLLFEGPSGAGFYIIFGFAGAWILILFSKRILAPLLQKSEDYYDGDGGNDDH